jgi:hypothetical protein
VTVYYEVLPRIFYLVKLRFGPTLSIIEAPRLGLHQPEMHQRHQQRLCRFALLPRFSIRIVLRMASLVTKLLESELKAGNMFEHGPLMRSHSSFKMQLFAVKVH